MNREVIPISKLEMNRGQVEGLPKNPRFFRDSRFEAMKKSIEDCPEMLDLRELIVYPYGDKYVVIGGNLRMRACKELGYQDCPCKVLGADTSVMKLREIASKDNISFGETDMDALLNEWDRQELQDWGMELPEEKKKDPFKERFDAVKNEDAVYPLIPKFDEKHELFIIQSANEVDSNWLRERLNMQHMKSYKTGKVMKSNVISVKDVREALENCHPQP